MAFDMTQSAPARNAEIERTALSHPFTHTISAESLRGKLKRRPFYSASSAARHIKWMSLYECALGRHEAAKTLRLGYAPGHDWDQKLLWYGRIG